MSSIYHSNSYYYSHILVTQCLHLYNFNCSTSKTARLRMFNSTGASRRRETRSQTRDRAIVSTASQSSIISSSNFFMFSFSIDRVTELSDDAQFENSDENNDFVDFGNVDVSAKHISVFESLVSSIGQFSNSALVTHFSQSETQRKNNFVSLSPDSDVVVSAAADSSVILKQMKMRIRILEVESKLNDSKIFLAKTKTERDRDRRRRRSSDDQYENSFSHIKRRVARSKISDTQKCEN